MRGVLAGAASVRSGPGLTGALTGARLAADESLGAGEPDPVFGLPPGGKTRRTSGRCWILTRNVVLVTIDSRPIETRVFGGSRIVDLSGSESASSSRR